MNDWLLSINNASILFSSFTVFEDDLNKHPASNIRF